MHWRNANEELGLTVQLPGKQCVPLTRVTYEYESEPDSFLHYPME